jgi:hypothetical protein
MRLIFLTAAALAGMMLLSCGKGQNDSKETADVKRNKDQQEYRLIRTELVLIKTEKPYLALDFNKKKIMLKLKGAVLWSYPMNFAVADSSEINEFWFRFIGDRSHLVRVLKEKYLFEGTKQTPDSILAIVSRALKVDPSLLQRVLPERFQLRWADGLFLEIQTDVSGEPISKVRNAIAGIGKAVRLPFGEATITIKMDAVDALTLYRATAPGIPTLIYPPS